MLQVLVVTAASARDPGSQTTFLHWKDVVASSFKQQRENELWKHRKKFTRFELQFQVRETEKKQLEFLLKRYSPWPIPQQSDITEKFFTMDKILADIE